MAQETPSAALEVVGASRVSCGSRSRIGQYWKRSAWVTVRVSMGQPSGQECRRYGAVGGLQFLPGVGDRAQEVGVGCLELVDEQDQSLVVGVRSCGLGGVGYELRECAGGFGSGPLGAGQFDVAHSWYVGPASADWSFQHHADRRPRALGRRSGARGRPDLAGR